MAKAGFKVDERSLLKDNVELVEEEATEKPKEKTADEIKEIEAAWQREVNTTLTEKQDVEKETKRLQAALSRLAADSPERAQANKKLKENEEKKKAIEEKLGEAQQRVHECKMALVQKTAKDNALAAVAEQRKQNEDKKAQAKAAATASSSNGANASKEAAAPKETTKEKQLPIQTASQAEATLCLSLLGSDKEEKKAKKQAARLALESAKKVAQKQAETAEKAAKEAKAAETKLKAAIEKDAEDSDSSSEEIPAGQRLPPEIGKLDAIEAETGAITLDALHDKCAEQAERLQREEIQVQKISEEQCRRSLTVSGIPPWRLHWETDKVGKPTEKEVMTSLWSLLRVLSPQAHNTIEEMKLRQGDSDDEKSWRALLLFRREERAEALKMSWNTCAAEVPDALFLGDSKLTLMKTRTPAEDAAYKFLKYMFQLINAVFGDKRPKRWQANVREVHIAEKIFEAESGSRRQIETARPILKLAPLLGNQLSCFASKSFLAKALEKKFKGSARQAKPENEIKETFEEMQKTWGAEEQRLQIKIISVEDDIIEQHFEGMRTQQRQAPPKWLQKPTPKEKPKETSDDDDAQILGDEAEDDAKEAAELELVKERKRRWQQSQNAKAKKTQQPAKKIKKTKAQEEFLEEEPAEEEPQQVFAFQGDQGFYAAAFKGDKGSFKGGFATAFKGDKGSFKGGAAAFKGDKGKKGGKKGDKGKKGKGKGKGKGKEAFQFYEAPQVFAPQVFQGHCLTCGAYGHRARDCWHG